MLILKRSSYFLDTLACSLYLDKYIARKAGTDEPTIAANKVTDVLVVINFWYSKT